LYGVALLYVALRRHESQAQLFVSEQHFQWHPCRARRLLDRDVTFMVELRCEFRGDTHGFQVLAEYSDGTILLVPRSDGRFRLCFDAAGPTPGGRRTRTFSNSGGRFGKSAAHSGRQAKPGGHLESFKQGGK
jgi:hypothetical protein